MQEHHYLVHCSHLKLFTPHLQSCPFHHPRLSSGFSWCQILRSRNIFCWKPWWELGELSGTVLRSSSSLAQALHAAAVTSICQFTFSLPHKHGYLPATHINKWLLVPQSSPLCVVSLGVGPKWRTHISLMRWNHNMKHRWITNVAPLKTFSFEQKATWVTFYKFCCQLKDTGRGCFQINSSSDTLLQRNSSKVVAVTCSTAGLEMSRKSSLINTNTFESEAVLAKPRVLLCLHKWARALVCCTGQSAKWTTLLPSSRRLKGDRRKLQLNSFCILMGMVRILELGFSKQN